MHVSLRGTIPALLSLFALAGCGGPANTLPYGNTVSGPPRAAALYVAAAQVPGSLSSMSATATGTVTPSTLIAGANAGLAYNFFAFIDPSGRLWTTNCLSLPGTNGPVVAFNAGATGNIAPAITIQGPATGLSGCQAGIATDSAGFVYVADISNVLPQFPGGQIAIFAPGAQGNVAPARVIAGPLANLHSPTGLYVDASGFVYVADSAQGFLSTPPDVQVFAPNSNGNLSSARVISGSNTNLAAPEGVVVDSAGNIYVANSGNNSIAVFAPNASGNVAPIRLIQGANTKLDAPCGLALDSAGYLYVGTLDAKTNGPVLVFAPNANGNASPFQSIFVNVPNYAAPAGVAVR